MVGVPGGQGAFTQGDGVDPYPVRSLVSHREWGSGTVMRAEDDRITVYFESEGYKVLSLAAVDAGGLLERTGQLKRGS